MQERIFADTSDGGLMVTVSGSAPEVGAALRVFCGGVSFCVVHGSLPVPGQPTVFVWPLFPFGPGEGALPPGRLVLPVFEVEVFEFEALREGVAQTRAITARVFGPTYPTAGVRLCSFWKRMANSRVFVLNRPVM